MSERVPADKALRCVSCGDRFVFSSGEQELYRLRGITTEPAQCPSCAHGRVVAAGEARGASPRGSG